MNNNNRAQQVLALIKANPEHHDQKYWHCGTSHCFAGFGDCIARAETEGKPVRFDSFKVGYECTVDSEWFGITPSAWITITHPANTLAQLELLIDLIDDSGCIDLVGANLAGIDLSYVHLVKTDLSSANLTGANLANAKLLRADLTNADLSCANLANADLSYADLTSTNLTGANLTNADLTSTNLTGANLANADLSYADLTSANLTDANLTNTTLSVNGNKISNSNQSSVANVSR